uniref:acyl-coenzyme A thioesterase THEM4-like n=1 Tax=Myxine glutinosa TaxID=7769 RepID=UPI00358DF491
MAEEGVRGQRQRERRQESHPHLAQFSTNGRVTSLMPSVGGQSVRRFLPPISGSLLAPWRPVMAPSFSWPLVGRLLPNSEPFWAWLPACLCYTSDTEMDLKDYGTPNSSWTSETLNLYNKFLNDSWIKLPSTRRYVQMGKFEDLKSFPNGRLLTRCTDEEGSMFEHAMFYNLDNVRLACVAQFGPYVEGVPGLAHGGATAALIDEVLGTLAFLSLGRVMTVNLNINYIRTIPLLKTILFDAELQSKEDRKATIICKITNPDGSILHAEGKGIFVSQQKDI